MMVDIRLRPSAGIPSNFVDCTHGRRNREPVDALENMGPTAVWTMVTAKQEKLRQAKNDLLKYRQMIAHSKQLLEESQRLIEESQKVLRRRP